MTLKVAVIGCGVNGLSCAVQAIEHFKEKAEVTIISENFSPNTTGDISAGLWGPHLVGSTSPDKILEWSKSMHEFLHNIWLSEDAGEAGVCLIPCIRVTNTSTPMTDFWKDVVYGYHQMTENELLSFSKQLGKKLTSGVHFLTYTSEPTKLLPYLTKRFTKAGGEIIQKKIEDFEEFVKNSNYDCVINCSGLGSRDMVKDDSAHAIRGQVSRVEANWMYNVFLDESDDGSYIIPNCESVVLGGTHQEHDYNTNVSESDKKAIMDGCTRIVKGIQNAPLIKDVVGLRPGRPKVRLEKKIVDDKIIIHNYGHGGSGVTVCWGCGKNVLDLLKKSVKV